LLDAKCGTAQGDELELLSILVELYEDEHSPIGPPTPIEAIKFRLEQSGQKQKDLIPYIGSASKVSEVMNGKRPLSINMIRALHKHLGISAEILLQETTSHSSLLDKIPRHLRHGSAS
jgi:HTH-type transcriptional regulator/antitoxin HigA